MPIFAKSKPKRDPIPEGLYSAICYGVYDLGTHYNAHFGNDARLVLICWELPEIRIELERDGKKLNLPQAISRQFTLSLHKKANLRKVLEGWRGKRFTEEESNKFDIAKLIGVGCQLQVMHSAPTEDGTVYANVDQVLPAPKGFNFKMENVRQYFSFDDNMDIPENTPEWIEKKIQESEQWKERQNPQVKPPEPDEPGSHDEPIDESSSPF